jgi:hypothetical protein
MSTQPDGFWTRSTVALVLALYAWSMIGVTAYLRFARPADGPSQALATFRRMVMGRGVVALGAAAVLAAIILALFAKRRRKLAGLALAISLGWVVTVLLMWPI